MGQEKHKRPILTPKINEKGTSSTWISSYDGNVRVKLGDAAGADKFRITDSSTVEVASINSDGTLTAIAITGSGLLSASSKATVNNLLTASSKATVTNLLTASSKATVNNLLTATSKATVTLTLTASSAFVVPVQSVASTAITLQNHGIVYLPVYKSSGAAKTYKIAAPAAGRIVHVFSPSTASSTGYRRVQRATTAYEISTTGGAKGALVFGSRGASAILAGKSSTSYLLMATRGTVAFTT